MLKLRFLDQNHKQDLAKNDLFKIEARFLGKVQIVYFISKIFTEDTLFNFETLF